MLYVLSKIVKALVDPANMLSLLLLLGALMGISKNPGVQKAGRRLCLALGIIFFVVAVAPVDQWLLRPLENAFPPERPTRVDGIILLAGDEHPLMTETRGQASVDVSARRHMRFAALAREYPDARLVFAGGNNALMPKGSLTNADVARMAMKELGIEPDKVIYENTSQNTYENALFSAKIVEPKAHENWLLVTSASHMPRSLLTFRKIGWNVYPAPTDYHTTRDGSESFDFNLIKHLQHLHTVFYEYTGLLTYKILGRI